MTSRFRCLFQRRRLIDRVFLSFFLYRIFTGFSTVIEGGWGFDKDYRVLLVLVWFLSQRPSDKARKFIEFKCRSIIEWSEWFGKKIGGKDPRKEGNSNSNLFLLVSKKCCWFSSDRAARRTKANAGVLSVRKQENSSEMNKRKRGNHEEMSHRRLFVFPNAAKCIFDYQSSETVIYSVSIQFEGCFHFSFCCTEKPKHWKREHLGPSRARYWSINQSINQSIVPDGLPVSLMFTCGRNIDKNPAKNAIGGIEPLVLSTFPVRYYQHVIGILMTSRRNGIYSWLASQPNYLVLPSCFVTFPARFRFMIPLSIELFKSIDSGEHVTVYLFLLSDQTRVFKLFHLLQKHSTAYLVLPSFLQLGYSVCSNIAFTNNLPENRKRKQVFQVSIN